MQPTKRQPRLIEHLEKYLGPISRGMRDVNENRFQILEFRSPPFSGCVGYVTLGASDTLLEGVGGKRIRQEFVLLFRDRELEVRAPAILGSIAATLLDAGRALLRGGVVELERRFWRDSQMGAVYASIPVYLPDEFAVCRLSLTDSCVLAWLVPIYDREREFVLSHGWEAFEDKLVEHDPDLLDLDRDPIPGLC